MHSFRHSRGRVSFELFCALIVAASCAGAWIQTGAWALLPAAFVALLYAVVHAFDLARYGSAAVPDARRIEVAAEAADPDSVELAVVEETAAVAASPSRAKLSRRKAPQKGGARRAGAASGAKRQPPRPEQPQPIELPVPEAAVAEAAISEEMAHAPLAPLFEPEPFVRQQQQRTGFGRKAG